MRDTEGCIEDAKVGAQGVFDDEVKAIKAGTEWNGFLVNRRQAQRGLEKGFGKIARNDILKGLNDGPTRSGDAPVEIQDGGMNALLALKTKIAIGNLYGDRDEDSVAGHAKKIRSIVHVNFIVDDSRADFFFEVPESLGRALDAKVAIGHIELVHARRSRAERNGAGCSIGVGEAARFGR